MSGTQVQRAPVQAAARHAIRQRVYYEDTDAGGVVYYANYLKLFERCRTELLRSRGIEQESMRRAGIGFVVRRAEIAYHASARLDDEVEIGAEVVDLRAASAWFMHAARRDGALLADGRVQVACVDLQRGRPIAIPHHVVAALQATPASEPSVDRVRT